MGHPEQDFQRAIQCEMRVEEVSLTRAIDGCDAAYTLREIR